MLSVCIITKNEAENLKECLKRLKQYNVEIIVVDTDSSVMLFTGYFRKVNEQ